MQNYNKRPFTLFLSTVIITVLTLFTDCHFNSFHNTLNININVIITITSDI